MTYFGPPSGVAPWFASLGYAHKPALHGTVSDWVLALVCTNYSRAEQPPEARAIQHSMTSQQLHAAADAFAQHTSTSAELLEDPAAAATSRSIDIDMLAQPGDDGGGSAASQPPPVMRLGTTADDEYSRPTYPSPSSTHRQFTGGREFFFMSTPACMAWSTGTQGWPPSCTTTRCW
jgi:hypothetical protein